MQVIYKTLVSLGRDTKYFDARRRVADKGMKLASNVLHDDYLVGIHEWKGIHRWSDMEDYPAWAREIIVHPEKNGKFRKGADVVDSKTGWVLPRSYLTNPKFINNDVFMKSFNRRMDLGLIAQDLRRVDPRDLIFLERVGLFIDPEDFDTKNKSRIVVIPASIVLLYPFIQENVEMGKVDEITRIPLALAPENEQEKRWLFRIDGAGVRPLVRGRHLWGDDNGRIIDSDYRPTCRLGVMGEAPKGTLSQL